MGGKLFSTKRLEKTDYIALCDKVMTKMKWYGRDAAIPRTFNNKADFGDIDICLRDPLLNDAALKFEFGITDNDIHWNNNVASIRYKDFQIDLCFFPENHLQTALNYMQFGDLSNMIGVICNKAFGFRYTHKGLVVPIKFKQEDCLGEIEISYDLPKIFEFIDLDYKTYNNGFVDELEAFEWITKSQYFNKDFFAFENLNHQNRTRNRKRAMYSRFVEWIKDKTFENNHIPVDNKSIYIWSSCFHFGSWVNRAEPMITERRKMVDARNKWNATDIIRITGYNGRQLGECVLNFERYIENVKGNSYINYINLHTKEQIEREFAVFMLSQPEHQY